MSLINKFLLFFILLSGIFACETYVEIDVPPIKKKPVLTCLFTKNKPFKLRLTMSADVNDTSIVFIKNATVKLFADGKFIEHLQEQDSGFYLSSHLVEPKILYSVEADVDGFPIIKASDSLPELIKAEQVYFKLNAIYDYGNQFAKANILFSDPPGNNYYELALYAKYTYYNDWDGTYREGRINDNIAYWLIDDPALEVEDITGWIGSVSFNDELFNGKKYQLQIPVEKLPANAEHYVRFSSVSYHYYKYKSVLDRHLFNQGGWSYDGLLLITGGNPLEMYSNVENAYGIFAGYVSQEIEVTDIRE